MFESKEKLIAWQKILINNSPDKLVLSKRELKKKTFQEIEFVKSTIKGELLTDLTKAMDPDLFFCDLIGIEVLLERFLKLETYVKVQRDTTIQLALEVIKNKQKIIYDFLMRYFLAIDKKANKLKTSRGKKNQYQKFYDSLKEYYSEMDNNNINYIEEKYKYSISKL